MSNIGDRQAEILRHFAKSESFTKSEAVDLIGGSYYCNASKHVGDVLSRMVKSGLITRIKPGLFKVGMDRKPLEEREDGKCKWCEGRGCLVCAKTSASQKGGADE